VAPEITLLGDVSIRDTGSEARRRGSLGSPQARVAFTLLTLERHHGVTRDALADALWPHRLPPTWASALRTVVSRVRGFVARALGQDDDDDLLVARGGSYILRLPEDTVVDIELAERQITEAREALADGQPERALRQADEATARLGAPLLPDHDGEWVGAQRARLADLLVVGLEVMSRAAVSLGDSGSALAAAHEAVRQAPLRESAHRCLMAAHAATGNRAEALRAYQRLRRMLAEEIGVEPDAETEAAYLDLLGPPLLAARPASSEGEVKRSPLRPGMSVPFVGRDTELSAVGAAWSEALIAGRQVVVVTGEAGAGKTRFTSTFARSVTAEGALVLFGRCDQDPIIPYQPVVEMLDAVVAATPDHEMPQLSASAKAELAAVFPSFAGAAPATATTDRTVLFDAVTKLASNVARDHPILIVVDDLHWADGESALLLGHLLRSVSQERILVMLVARDELPLHHVLDQAIRALDRDGVVLHIRLGGIDVTSYRALCREVAPRATDLLAMAPKLVADTSGNPSMLVELLGAYIEGVPPDELASGPVTAGLDNLVASRLASVGPVVRTLLDAAAVCGNTFDLTVVAAATGLDEDVAVEALDIAAASGFVVEVDASHRDSYRLAQDVVRRTLYGRLSQARRRLLHGRIADTLEDHRKDPKAIGVASLAHHRCAGAEPGGDIRAVRLALAAAAEAQAVGAPSEAMRWCRTALDHVAPGDAALQAEVVTELGLAEVAQDPANSGQTLFDGAVRARRCGRIDLAARAALGLANLSRRRSELRQDAYALIQALLVDAQPAGRPGPQLSPEVWARLVARQLELGGAAPGVVTEATTAVSILRGSLADLEGPDDRDQRFDIAHDVETLATANQDSVALAEAYHHQAMVGATIGDGAIVDEALQAMCETLQSAGSRVGELLLHERRLALAVAQGRPLDMPQPRVAGNQASSPFDLGSLPPGEAAVRQLVVLRWLQDQPTEASAQKAPEAGTSPASVTSAGFGPAEDALAALALGERGRARLLISELASDGRQLLPPGDGWLHAIGLLGLAVVELGDPTVALDLYELLAPYAALTCGVGYRSFVGTAAFHLGRLAAVGGEWAEAEQHLASALRQLTAIRAYPWVALTQRTLARVLEALGRSSDLEWIAAFDAEAQWLARKLGLPRV
jgi:DNA-binding SARP family transcriptional activator